MFFFFLNSTYAFDFLLFSVPSEKKGDSHWKAWFWCIHSACKLDKNIKLDVCILFQYGELKVLTYNMAGAPNKHLFIHTQALLCISVKHSVNSVGMVIVPHSCKHLLLVHTLLSKDWIAETLLCGTLMTLSSIIKSRFSIFPYICSREKQGWDCLENPKKEKWNSKKRIDYKAEMDRILTNTET